MSQKRNRVASEKIFLFLLVRTYSQSLGVPQSINMFLKYFLLISCVLLLFVDNSYAKASTAEREPQVVSASNITRSGNRALPKFGTPYQYEPTWESLDSRPLPQWYDDAKVGQ